MNMVSVEVAKAGNSALDYAAAVCEGGTNFLSDGITWGFELNGERRVLSPGWAPAMVFCPTTVWANGGPIIERETIELHSIPARRSPENWANCSDADSWLAQVFVPDRDAVEAAAPTPLLAAMRAYVMARMGETIQVPSELASRP